MKRRAPDLTNSPSLDQIASALASYLAKRAEEHLTFNQGVTGSRPVRPTIQFVFLC